MLYDILENLSEERWDKILNGLSSSWTESQASLFIFGFLFLALWALFWKACALWVAAKNNQPKWFVALLAINTLGLFEIGFLLYHYKKGTLHLKS